VDRGPRRAAAVAVSYKGMDGSDAVSIILIMKLVQQVYLSVFFLIIIDVTNVT
jgi:hypothetical protein